MLGKHSEVLCAAHSLHSAHMTPKSSAPLLVALTALVGSASLAFAGAPAGKEVKDIKEVAPPVEREDLPVHPITTPYYHEDSFIGTDLRPVFVYHKFPGEILGGNRATVTALQLRIQLTKSLQLVAY